jgi:DNA polymerase II large subunit
MAGKKKPQVEGYCVKCKKNVAMVNAKKCTTKNGRDMMKGQCPFCDGKLCRFVSMTGGGLYF